VTATTRWLRERAQADAERNFAEHHRRMQAGQLNEPLVLPSNVVDFVAIHKARSRGLRLVTSTPDDGNTAA
jgi:hypothetical protein